MNFRIYLKTDLPPPVEGGSVEAQGLGPISSSDTEVYKRDTNVWVCA
jgi:hypothetical protein